MKKIFLVLIALGTCFAAYAQHQNLRVEPPFWYAQMPTEKLQLMLHDEGIGEYRASVKHKGITLVNQVVGDSPNYLFINLTISPEVTVGSFDVLLKKGSKEMSFSYELKERPKGAQRNQGFSSEDVIYLLMPDRFANGNPENDTVEGMLEPARRDDPSGRHGGDIQGVLEHLDYIKNLGMTEVWLTPVFENDQTPE